LFTTHAGGSVIESTYVNQQASQGWVLVATVHITAGIPFAVRISNDGTSTTGLVLRSDAIRISWRGETVATTFIVDDGGPGYVETGSWSQSVAQAFGPSSRFSGLTAIGSGVTFSTSTVIPGDYSVEFIVPASSNATNHARYRVLVDGSVRYDTFVDQTMNGSQWVSLGTFRCPSSASVEVRVTNEGGHTSGEVLRADAVRVILVWPSDAALLSSTIPERFLLHPAYPNPFNGETTFRIDVPGEADLTVTVCDILGRAVFHRLMPRQNAGQVEVRWRASDNASGIYFVRVVAHPHNGTAPLSSHQKVMLLR
jgi:hypothetical protein